jgi:hypothetical protein
MLAVVGCGCVQRGGRASKNGRAADRMANRPSTLGVATFEGKRPLMFSLAGYTAQAREWANRASVACFEFAIDGSIEAADAAAEDLLRVAR